MSKGYNGLTPDQIRDYRYHFQQFDLNGDGVISATELKVVFKNMGYRMTEQQINVSDIPLIK
jgi:Ca2+-binding EF-hand superfamily protein